jgi:hypothetical protein
MRQRLSRQQVFEIVWNHFIVEGMPFCIKENENGYPEPRMSNTVNGTKSPMALVTRGKLNDHVDTAFLVGLQSAHVRATRFVFNNVNIKRIKDFYSRAYRRTFRRTMKYFLIAFGIEYDLTIPSERAITIPALRLAAKNKR